MIEYVDFRRMYHQGKRQTYLLEQNWDPFRFSRSMPATLERQRCRAPSVPGSICDMLIGSVKEYYQTCNFFISSGNLILVHLIKYETLVPKNWTIFWPVTCDYLSILSSQSASSGTLPMMIPLHTGQHALFIFDLMWKWKKQDTLDSYWKFMQHQYMTPAHLTDEVPIEAVEDPCRGHHLLQANL